MADLNWGLLQQGQGGNALVAGIEAGSQAKRQDRKDAAEEAAIASRGRVANALAKDDYAGATKEAAVSGNPELMSAVMQMSKANREALSYKMDKFGTVALGLTQLPQEQWGAAFEAAKPTLKAAGFTDEELAKTPLTPEGLRGAISGAMTLKDHIAQANSDRKYTQDESHFQAGQVDKSLDRGQRKEIADANRGVTIRGQNMVDARARETSGGAKVPAGYRDKGDGTLEYIPGGPADPTKGAGKKAPTEDQAKNLQLYQRTSQQLPIVLDNFDALSNPLSQAGSKVPGTTYFTSEKYQRASGALKDIAASYLYSVSGATANPGEVKNLTDTVTPTIGDSAQTIADKKARVQQMVESIKTRAGSAYQDPAPAKGPKVGYVQQGYRFTGGNPADKSNWEKLR